MSVIGIRCIPLKWDLVTCVKHIGRIVNGPFEVLNFKPQKINAKYRVLYIRLSEKLDPVRIVERITHADGAKYKDLVGFVPDTVPDIPLAKVKYSKLPAHVRKLVGRKPIGPQKMVVVGYVEIMKELQIRYPGFLALSGKTGDKLLNEIAGIILDRLFAIVQANKNLPDNPFNLTKMYRKTHPHFGDFQLILSTLHKLQDAAGAPRAQIQESELAAVAYKSTFIGNLPYEKVKEACQHYSDKVINKVQEHIREQNSVMSIDDSEEEVARKKIRQEMKKLSQHLPTIIRRIVTKHFIPEQNGPRIKMCIYGEPYLPKLEALVPLTRGAYKLVRSKRMYNLVLFCVPRLNYPAIITMDGSFINGLKLVIRPYVVANTQRKLVTRKVYMLFGGEPEELTDESGEDNEDLDDGGEDVE